MTSIASGTSAVIRTVCGASPEGERTAVECHGDQDAVEIGPALPIKVRRSKPWTPSSPT